MKEGLALRNVTIFRLLVGLPNDSLPLLLRAETRYGYYM